MPAGIDGTYLKRESTSESSPKPEAIPQLTKVLVVFNRRKGHPTKTVVDILRTIQVGEFTRAYLHRRAIRYLDHARSDLGGLRPF